MKFLSSAKINLNLEVNSETKDGLHTLTSYLIPIDFYDVIEINEIDEKNDKIDVLEMRIEQMKESH